MRSALATLVALACVSAPIIGCSTLVPKLESPHLSIVGMEVVRADLLQQQLRVRMHVQNPNDRALPVRGITYSVQLGGEDFAHGESERNFVVPALGEMDFDVNVFANAAPVILKYITGSRPDAVEYRITGKVQLSAGLVRSVPFNQTGSFKLR
jgi:LEA14-like dessication related protein